MPFQQLVTCSQIQVSPAQLSSVGTRGAGKRRIVSALGFSSCPSVHATGVWNHVAATSSTMQIWRLDPETPRLTSPFSFTSAPPICLAPTASRAVNKLSKEGLSAKSTDKSEGRDDVDDRDVVYQDLVSAFFPTPSTVTSESLARILFPQY